MATGSNMEMSTDDSKYEDRAASLDVAMETPESNSVDHTFALWNEVCREFVDLNKSVNSSIRRKSKTSLDSDKPNTTGEGNGNDDDEMKDTFTPETNVSAEELSTQIKTITIRLANMSQNFHFVYDYVGGASDTPDDQPDTNPSGLIPDETDSSSSRVRKKSVQFKEPESKRNEGKSNESNYTSFQASMKSLCATISSYLSGSYSFVDIQEAERVCFNCVNRIRVESIHGLEKGDHLTFQRAIGYQHHAILVNAEADPTSKDGSVGKLTVIHKTANARETALGMVIYFVSAGNFGQKAYLKEETIDVDFKKSEIYVLKYNTKPFTNSGIVRRARKEVENLQAGKDEAHYSLFQDNCEHFATWCATGEWFSFQIDLIKCILTALRSMDSSGYNRMLEHLNSIGLLCADCYKETTKVMDEEKKTLSRGMIIR